MKKKAIVLILVTLLLVVACAAYFLRQNRTDPVTGTNLTYNPNYASAIQQKKPELCEQISYAVFSGPTDGLSKSYGKRAVATCKEQARRGFVGCMCDSNAMLNKMSVQ